MSTSDQSGGDEARGNEATVPARLGRYRIDAALGHGAMGMVYRAHDESIGRTVAIKTVRQELLQGSEGADFLKRFRREVQAAGRCTHPNIVAIHDFSETPPTPFIVMEFVQGNALSAHMASGEVFTLDAAFPIVSQILNALHFAHANGIVHRDIKPANILLPEGGQVKVTDFGVARLDSTNTTQVGTIVGTPGYMPPEQFTGGELNQRADLYATGAMLFEMVTGQKPYHGRSFSQMMHDVINLPISELPAFDRVPAALQPVLQRAMAKRPAERFANGQEFTEALYHALTQDSTGHGDATQIFPRPGTVIPPARETPGGWDPDTLRRIEDDLVAFIGPVAKVMVSRRAAGTSDLEELYQTLSRNIVSDQDRQRFLRRGRGLQTTMGSGRGLQTTMGSGAATVSTLDERPLPAAVFSPDLLEVLRSELAQHVGPIASVMVRRAAQKASDLPDLHRRLGEQLDPTARAAFLARLA